jgi:putative membrane protein
VLGVALLIHWLVGAIALVISSLVAKGLGFDLRVETDKPLLLLVGVVVLGLVNATIGRIARLITLPLACLTFGLAWVVINALLFWWVGTLGLGFKVGGFVDAVVGSVLMSVVGGLLRGIAPGENK